MITHPQVMHFCSKKNIFVVFVFIFTVTVHVSIHAGFTAELAGFAQQANKVNKLVFETVVLPINHELCFDSIWSHQHLN